MHKAPLAKAWDLSIPFPSKKVPGTLRGMADSRSEEENVKAKIQRCLNLIPQLWLCKRMNILILRIYVLKYYGIKGHNVQKLLLNG